MRGPGSGLAGAGVGVRAGLSRGADGFMAATVALAGGGLYKSRSASGACSGAVGAALATGGMAVAGEAAAWAASRAESLTDGPIGSPISLPRRYGSGG